jgi:hypothetical protein
MMGFVCLKLHSIVLCSSVLLVKGVTVAVVVFLFKIFADNTLDS